MPSGPASSPARIASGPRPTPRGRGQRGRARRTGAAKLPRPGAPPVPATAGRRGVERAGHGPLAARRRGRRRPNHRRVEGQDHAAAAVSRDAGHRMQDAGGRGPTPLLARRPRGCLRDRAADVRGPGEATGARRRRAGRAHVPAGAAKPGPRRRGGRKARTGRSLGQGGQGASLRSPAGTLGRPRGPGGGMGVDDARGVPSAAAGPPRGTARIVDVGAVAAVTAVPAAGGLRLPRRARPAAWSGARPAARHGKDGAGTGACAARATDRDVLRARRRDARGRRGLAGGRSASRRLRTPRRPTFSRGRRSGADRLSRPARGPAAPGAGGRRPGGPPRAR